MNKNKIIYLIGTTISIIWLSIYFGDFLKNYNPYFKNINIYLIDISFGIVCILIFILSYYIYDKIKKIKKEKVIK